MTPLGAPEGESEHFPMWFVVLKAASYLNVPPWELINMPRAWTSWAITAMSAEGKANQDRMERARSQNRSRVPKRRR